MSRALRIISLALVLLVAACSTQKNTFFSRTYHRLVSRDNGWFNANEKLKETVAQMEHDHVDDYDEVLPIFVYGTEEQAKALVPEMEKCIQKCAVVIDRHSMDIENKEQNTWIDDAYFVIGKSHFYKRSFFDAERNFDFIGRRFKGQNRQIESKVWLARTAIRQEQYAKAQSALDEVKNAKELPKRFPHDELSAVQADLNLKRGKVDDAITDLEHAVEITKHKKRRVRWMFILAQLYQAKGMEDKAIGYYNKVAHSNPPYELGFHAEVFQALAFDRGDSKTVRRKLNRMLRDEKNVDHFDMIHYALADIDLKENKDSSAIEELKLSARTSTTDTRQKAKSFLKLADLYFDDKQYPSAQQYYDSTQTLMSEEHKRYEEVRTRAEVLGELVEQLEIIAREDSLQAFMQLEPEEQERRIRKMIKERERMEEEKAAAEREAREVDNAPKPADKPQPGGIQNAGNWYFYNPQQIARGQAEFKKKWGNRPNEDNWRRKDKSGGAVAEEDPEETEGGEQASKDGEPAWKDPANYMKDLPRDSSALNASNAKICEALYIAGTIYKEKLKDIDNAVESFELLKGRFEECEYTAESYYQLYRIYLDKERKGSYIGFEESQTSKYWAEQIMERWPDSEFARLVKDPNQLQSDEVRYQQEEEAYTALYGRFRDGYYVTVVNTCDSVVLNEPKNHLLPKYHMLRAMAVGGTHDMAAFRAALLSVKSKYPGTDEAKAAEQILKTLDGQGGQNVGEDTGEEKQAPAATYKPPMGKHYVVLVYPTADGNIETVKKKLSDFSQQYFPGTTVNVNASMLDPSYQVLMLSMFQNKEKALEYYELMQSDKAVLPGVNDQGYATFAISTENYPEFYKSKDIDGYTAFFTKNYLEGE